VSIRVYSLANNKECSMNKIMYFIVEDKLKEWGMEYLWSVCGQDYRNLLAEYEEAGDFTKEVAERINTEVSLYS